MIDENTNQALPPCPEAPSWRVVLPGFVWKAHCNICRENVLINEGYGVIKLFQKKENLICPICKKKVQPGAFGFYKCTVKIEGQKITNEEYCGELRQEKELYDDNLHIYEKVSDQEEIGVLHISTQENK